MAELKEWWENISPREQQLSMISAFVICVAVLYWGILAPLVDQLDNSQMQLSRAEKTLVWTQDKADFLLKAGVAKSPAKGKDLTKVLNRTASQGDITFSRIVNKKGKVEVLITEVEFDAFVKWLAKLSNQHGIAVFNADLAKTDRPGYIKVNRLLLGNK